MGFFSRKTRVIEQQVDADKTQAVEIIAHKRATQQQINQVKKVNETLNNQLLVNGFTLKITLAAGGRHRG